MGKKRTFQLVEILSADMQNLIFFQPDQQTEECGKELGNNSSPGCTCNAHMERNNKKQI